VHPDQHRIDLCNRALEAVRHAISADSFYDVHEYINRFDEWGLGMEMLIDWLTEFDVEISGEQFGLIQATMDSMGLGECNRIIRLREQVVDFRRSLPQ
jgi:hypothetical protein